MDVVRCLCARDSLGDLCGTPHPKCAIHGPSPADPSPCFPWALTWTDRKFLAGMRIGPSDIEEVRQADEGRFNPPRQA